MGRVIDFKTRKVLDGDKPIEAQRTSFSAKSIGGAVTKLLKQLSDEGYDINNSVLVVPSDGGACVANMNPDMRILDALGVLQSGEEKLSEVIEGAIEDGD